MSGDRQCTWIVASSSGSTCRPRFVRVHQGHYKCESDRTYFQTCKVCAHVVATAQKNGDLEKVIAWHKRQGHSINATTLAQTGLPKASIGKKQATRKGVSKKKSAKIRKLCAEGDESSWQPRAALSATHPHSSQNVLPPAQFSVAAGIPPQALPSTPLDPFMLAFIRGNISVCFGCKQHYPNPINPPGDLCIMHKEWRSITLPGSPAPQSRFGNAYYHMHLPCIWSMWPQFDPQRHLIIPSAIATALLPAHKQALAASFKVFLD